jgi:hypothetical protein
MLRGPGFERPPEGALEIFVLGRGLWSNGVLEIPNNKSQISNKSQ